MKTLFEIVDVLVSKKWSQTTTRDVYFLMTYGISAVDINQ